MEILKIIIYIIGGLVTYYMARKIDKSFTNIYSGTDDKIFAAMMSLFSWIGVCFFLPMYIVRCTKLKKFFDK